MRGKQEENKLKEAVLPLLQDQYFQLQNDLEEMEERLNKKISAAGNQEYYFKELKFLIWILSIAFILMLAIVLYRQ
ncbi:MAG TPA: hypothetical protein VFQ98_04205 [Gallionella sp.]|nr:hypothetical protein [Gallionella sp.]